MAQECGFFNAQLVGEDEYDRVYLAEQFAAYFASFIGNGVFGKSMQKLEVMAQNSPNMSVKVLSGEAWINGWWYRNTEEYTLSLDVADGVLHRIDAIVLRWGNRERDMWLHVIKGTAASNPIAPDIRRDADYYDLQLATVAISRGAIKITQSAIKDTRLDNSVCGLVTGVVDQIDTTGLYNQFEQYFKEFKERYEADFDKWTKEQKQAYFDYVAAMRENYEQWTGEQKQSYLSYIAEMQAKYDDWISEQAQAYLDYIAATKLDYDQWTTDRKNAYDQWTAEKMIEYTQFINSSEQDYTQYIESKKDEYDLFISQMENNYNEWTEEQKTEYRQWYVSHTVAWTQEFTKWFESIKDMLSGDIAGNLQLKIDEHEGRLSRLEHMVFTGVLEAPLATDEYELIATLQGDDVIAAVWPICNCDKETF